MLLSPAQPWARAQEPAVGSGVDVPFGSVGERAAADHHALALDEITAERLWRDQGASQQHGRDKGQRRESHSSPRRDASMDGLDVAHHGAEGTATSRLVRSCG